jgi:predicted O-methyltransferase YrrM
LVGASVNSSDAVAWFQMTRSFEAVKRFVLQTSVGRALLVPHRLRTALSYCTPQLGQALRWTFSSRELANFTYNLTPRNREYLAHMVSVVTGTPYSSALDYLNEIDNDEDMKGRIQSRIAESSMRHCYDPVFAVGRRMGWYAFVRILKPKVIIETGVDKGHGSVVLCAALIRNEGEGFPGQYYGTDINPRAGYLLTDPYSRVGKILYGDSLQSLNKIAEIDVFINDSDHSAEYERREYEAILPKLRPGGIILGDNSHATSILAKFSEEHGRQFLFFREQPEDHWYPGAGIGISFEG